MSKDINNGEKMQSRKKFLSIGISTAALFTAFRYFMPDKKKVETTTESGTIKMLDQNGKLVEIDANLLSELKKTKITDHQLQNWIGKK